MQTMLLNITKDKLVTQSREKVIDLLERNGLDKAYEIDDVDHYVTPDGGWIIVVPEESNLGLVRYVFYTGKSSEWIQNLKKI